MKVIEFMGTPRSGKTTQIAKFKQEGVVIIEDREIEKEIFVPLTEAFEYNLQFFNKVYEKLLHAKHNGAKLVFLDRGFYDAMAWFMVEHRRGAISNTDLVTARNYFTHLQTYVDKVVFMNVDVKTSFQRDKSSGAEITDCSEYMFKTSYLSDLHKVYKELEVEYKDDSSVLILNGQVPPEITNIQIAHFLQLS